MNEDKATRYHRLRRRAVLLAAAWQAFLLAAMLVSGAGEALGGALASAFEPFPAFLRFPATVFAFVAVVAAVYGVGALPLSFYGGFTLERRYGLSRQPAGGWIRDHAKAAAIGLAFTGSAAVWMYAWLAAAPGYWWLPAWAGTATAEVAAAWAAPVMLLPLFYRFDPLPVGALRDRLLAVASQAGVQAIGVFAWRTSDRTPRANAALVGIGRTRRIILSDTLLNDHSPEEVEAVLAHELAHDASHDIWKELAVDAAVSLVAFLAADATLRAAVGPAGLQGLWDPAGLPAAGLAMTAVSWAASPVRNVVSRAHERRADRAALDLTQNVDAFVSAMRRLGARNLAEASPSLLTRLFFHTHPPVDERIAAASAWELDRGRHAGAEPRPAAPVRDGGT